MLVSGVLVKVRVYKIIQKCVKSIQITDESGEYFSVIASPQLSNFIFVD